MLCHVSCLPAITKPFCECGCQHSAVPSDTVFHVPAGDSPRENH